MIPRFGEFLDASERAIREKKPPLKPPCLRHLHWVPEDICWSKPDRSCLFRFTYQLKGTPWLKWLYGITLNWWIVIINVHIVSISQENSALDTIKTHQVTIKSSFWGPKFETKASVNAKTTTPAHSQRMAQASKCVTGALKIGKMKWGCP